jgi:hypothetical protein
MSISAKLWGEVSEFYHRKDFIKVIPAITKIPTFF